MSYASVAAKNTDGPQPTPDTALLNIEPTTTELPDVDSKVTIVEPGFKEHPATVTSQTDVFIPNAPEPYPTKKPAPADKKEEKKKELKAKKDEVKKEVKEKYHQAEEEGAHLWDVAKQRLFQPGVMGGILGLVNVGLIAGAGYQLYTYPALRQDTKTLSIAGVSALALFGAEGYLAEAYRQTDAGQREEKKAKEEGAALYKQAKEIVLRPGVLGGLAGVLNVGILGGVGYAAYTKWNEPKWDRRVVSAVTVGILGLFVGEGYLGEQYKEKEYPKRK